MNRILAQLHDNHQIWHGNNHHALSHNISTGDQQLDHYLSGGIPDASVIELQTINGIGELRLLVSFVASKAQSTRLISFIAPPSDICSQMLANHGIDPQQVLVLCSEQGSDSLWSAEQCLKSGCVGVVILWHQQFSTAQIKRFKLAAEQGQTNLIILRQQQSFPCYLPVPLSLSLSPYQYGLKVTINKQLGHWSKPEFLFDMRQRWPDLVSSSKPSNVIELKPRKVG